MSEDKVVPVENANQPEAEPVESQVVEKGPNEPAVPSEPEMVVEPEATPKEVETEAAPKEPATPKEPVERKVFTMPVHKATEAKDKAVEKAKEEARVEHEAEITKIRAEYEAKGTPQSHNDVVKLAEEYGYSAKDAEFIAKIIEQKTPKLDTSKYDELLKQQEIDTAKAEVSKEFDTSIVDLIKADFPAATPEHIAMVKKGMEELAFSTEYNTYRLEDIYKVNKSEFEFKNNLGAESSSGTNTETIDFGNLSDEEQNDLATKDPEMFKKFIKWEAGQGSRYLD